MKATQKSKLGKNIKAHFCHGLGCLSPYPAIFCSICMKSRKPIIHLDEKQFEALNEHYMKLKRDKLNGFIR